MLISKVPPTETQEWCLARISEHRDRIRRLREVYGPAAHNLVLKAKAHIRALRSEYTAAAPINRLLPPEVLTEVFSHVHPAVVSRGRVSVLHVCRYWRMIVLKTPQFWANLLSLPMQPSTNPHWCIARFTAALSLSTPRCLTLSLPFWSLDVVDLLIPRASRLASLTIHITFTSGIEWAKRLLEQHMPCLRELVIPNCSQYWEDPALTLPLHHYPNICSLQLGLRLYCSLAGPCASLRHLELTDCTMQVWLTSGDAPSLHSGLAALELFPNLENLFLIRSLSQIEWYEDLRKFIMKTIHLPRLRHLQIEDEAICVQSFLAYAVVPPTTSLTLEISHDFYFFEHPSSIPITPSINLPPAPDAEISLYLDFLHCVDIDRMPLGHPEGLAHWETHGGGTPPVHVTFIGAACCLEPVALFTHELARPLGRGVTALTATGTWVRRSSTAGSDRIPGYVLSAQEYWTAFLPDVAGLRRLTCAGFGATKDFIDVLGRPLPRSGEFPCPRLVDIAVVWHLSQAACECFHSELEREEGVEVDAGEELSPQDEEERAVGQTRQASLGSAVTASLEELCGSLEACLAVRTESCEPIQKLSVAIRGWYGEDLHMPRWQTALVERLIRDGLGHLVGELVFANEVG